MGSDSFGCPGSAGDSPRPSRDTAVATPGTSMIRFMASNSIFTDSSREMLGARTITGVTEPSCMIGINDLPNSGKVARLATRAPIAPRTTVRRFSNAQSSILR